MVGLGFGGVRGGREGERDLGHGWRVELGWRESGVGMEGEGVGMEGEGNTLGEVEGKSRGNFFFFFRPANGRGKKGAR